jgi:ferredoxin
LRRLWIDPDRCVGHGRCYELAPGLVADDEFGHGRVERETVGEADVPAAQLAEVSCPEGAVHLGGPQPADL